MKRLVLFGLGLLTLLCLPISSQAQSTCVFTYDPVALTMTLTGDCTTDTTIDILDGYTLEGAGYTITAVDPEGDHFRGAVVKNLGVTAHVTNLTVTTSNLANVCDHVVGADRLRGIMFEGASGSILKNTVFNLNQGASGCQEGNAVEVRNAPFDGTHLSTQTVEIAHNQLSSWQKSGIVCNGDVSCDVHHNTIGPSATQANLAANSVQFGFGALGKIQHNHIAQNSWKGPSDFVATAILVFLGGDGIVIKQNNLMEGNADVGIYFFASNGVVDNNRVFETGEDGLYDFGIVNWGLNNQVTNNKVRGYDTPYDNVEDGNNKVIPSPNDK